MPPPHLLEKKTSRLGGKKSRLGARAGEVLRELVRKLGTVIPASERRESGAIIQIG